MAEPIGTVVDPDAPVKDGRAERKPVAEDSFAQDARLPNDSPAARRRNRFGDRSKVNVFSVIEVVPDGESSMTFRASIYRGIGALRKTTPQGEVNVRPGDIILEAPGGLYVIDPLTASALFGDSLDDILYTDNEKSQREVEDLSSTTHSEEIRAAELARHQQMQADQDIVKRRENARQAAENARNQNIGGELRLDQQTHLRNVGGEVRVMPGPHPALNNPDVNLLTQEEKRKIDEENQSDMTGAGSLAPVSGKSSPEEGVTNIPGLPGMTTAEQQDEVRRAMAQSSQQEDRIEESKASGENQELPQKKESPIAPAGRPNPFDKVKSDKKK